MRVSVTNHRNLMLAQGFAGKKKPGGNRALDRTTNMITVAKKYANVALQPFFDLDAPTEAMSVMVTPQMASVWRKKWHYGGQRTFKQWHCDNLVRMMKAGIFRPKTQVSFVEVDGQFYLTNGQHTLAAIEFSNTTQELCVVVSKGHTMEDVADDFSRHDTHLTRQFADSLAAHSVHEELGVAINALHTITGAVAYYALLRGEITARSNMLTHDQKLVLVRKYGQLGTTAYRYFEGATNKSFLMRRTTLAPAMLCADKHDGAAEFWTAVARDDGLRQGDPRKTLLEWLRQRTTPGGRSGTSNSSDLKVAADHELVKGVAAAWNAWIQNRELKLIKVSFDATTAKFDHVGEFVVRAAAKKKAVSSEA